MATAISGTVETTPPGARGFPNPRRGASPKPCVNERAG
ncbi:hypothetical protein FRUB_06986 [Fimbriiglobus ruber]|uniref:Uncharacterized protein n=1 Tax=Fimbriiglobus ruber TaxID=1908690 RepID=A0A225DK98_9BACT|nr:hypothetical protein FRUB_06986 [Fimbriiglobus ruber]